EPQAPRCAGLVDGRRRICGRAPARRCARSAAGAGAGGMTSAAASVQNRIAVGGQAAELRLVAHGSAMLRISPIAGDDSGKPAPPPRSPELAVDDAGQILAGLRGAQEIRWARSTIRVAADPLSVAVTDAEGRACLALRFAADGSVGFALGEGPVFGLG